MMEAFNQISQSAIYRKDEVSVSLTVCGGSYGGGSEVLVIQEDESLRKDELHKVEKDRSVGNDKK